MCVHPQVGGCCENVNMQDIHQEVEEEDRRRRLTLLSDNNVYNVYIQEIIIQSH